MLIPETEKRMENKKTNHEKVNHEKNGSMQRYLTDCSLTRTEGKGNGRKFTISFSSEEPYDRWWGTEILSHAEGALDLTRLNSIGVVLYNHNRDKVIGKILRTWVEDGRGKAEIEFDSDAESEVIFQKVSGGTLKGVSVGYTVEDWEEVAADKKSGDGRFTGPCDIAVRWTPFEISVVSVPADPTVGVRRSKDTEDTKQGKAKGVSSLYHNERQLQINKNLLRR